MAKITALDVADQLTGDEHLPIVQGTDTKRTTLAAFRDLITPFLQNWYKGDRGDTGPANSTYFSDQSLKSALRTNGSYTAIVDGMRSDYSLLSENLADHVDGFDVIEMDGLPASQGALVRVQNATRFKTFLMAVRLAHPRMSSIIIGERGETVWGLWDASQRALTADQEGFSWFETPRGDRFHLLGGCVPLEAFSCIPDGFYNPASGSSTGTDNTAAAQAALNWARVRGGTLLGWPGGKYLVGNLYGHYDAVHNPVAPEARGGRFSLLGAASGLATGEMEGPGTAFLHKPNARASASITATIDGTTMTVNEITGAPLELGMLVRGQHIAPDQRIIAFGSGTGGTGTYTVAVSQTMNASAATASTAGPLLSIVGRFDPAQPANMAGHFHIDRFDLVGGFDTTDVLYIGGAQSQIDVSNLTIKGVNPAGNGLTLCTIWEAAFRNLLIFGPSKQKFPGDDGYDSSALCTGVGVNIKDDRSNGQINMLLLENINSYGWGWTWRIGRRNSTGTFGPIVISGGQGSYADQDGVWLDGGIQGVTFVGFQIENTRLCGMKISSEFADITASVSVPGVLTVTKHEGEPLAVGMQVRGPNVAFGTTISRHLTGSGGTGTYAITVPDANYNPVPSTQTFGSTAGLKATASDLPRGIHLLGCFFAACGRVQDNSPSSYAIYCVDGENVEIAQTHLNDTRCGMLINRQKSRHVRLKGVENRTSSGWGAAHGSLIHVEGPLVGARFLTEQDTIIIGAMANYITPEASLSFGRGDIGEILTLSDVHGPTPTIAFGPNDGKAGVPAGLLEFNYANPIEIAHLLGGKPMREVICQFLNFNVTLKKSNDLRLASDFKPSEIDYASAELRLRCNPDGSWREISRSFGQ